MDLLLFTLFITLLIKKSLCYVGCDFDFSKTLPAVGPYSCSLKINETIGNVDAYDLKGNHLDLMSDYDVHYVALNSIMLTDIPENLFIRFKNVENFSCINTTVRELKYRNFAYAHKLEYLWIIDNQINYMDNNFLSDASEKLELLVLSRNNIRNLTSNAFGRLKSLQDLYVDSNLLKVLKNDTFIGLTRLYRLSLVKNNIHTIEADAFNGLITLQVLYLDNNKIQKLDKNVFKSLKRLNLLSLNFNSISYIDKKLFEYFEQLGYVELRGNQLKFIAFIQTLQHIVHLDISENQIDAIEYFDIELLSNFEKIDAAGNLCVNKNKINSSEALNECFKNFRMPACKYYTDKHFGFACEILSLFNSDDDLPAGMDYEDVKYLKVDGINENFSFPLLSRKFQNVHKIMIKNTQLKHILEQNFDCVFTKFIDIRLTVLYSSKGGIFAECKDVEELVLIKNQIQALPDKFFNGLNGLISLDLSFNKLTNQDLNIYNYNFTKLLKLHLSNNKFTAIPNHSFKFMSKLKILKLDANRISHIDQNAFSGLTNLRELYLQHNGIENTLFLKNPMKLIYLNLEGNQIKYLSFMNSIKLQYIDVSFNPIEKIEVDAIKSMKYLNDMILIRSYCIDMSIFDIIFLNKNVTHLLQPCS